MGREVRRAVMESIRRDPVFKRMIMLFLAGFILISAAQVGLEAYELNRFHREKLSLMQSVVGEVAGLYPEREVEVVKAVLYGKDEKARRLGGGDSFKIRIGHEYKIL